MEQQCCAVLCCAVLRVHACHIYAAGHLLDWVGLMGFALFLVRVLDCPAMIHVVWAVGVDALYLGSFATGTFDLQTDVMSSWLSSGALLVGCYGLLFRLNCCGHVCWGVMAVGWVAVVALSSRSAARFLLFTGMGCAQACNQYAMAYWGVMGFGVVCSCAFL
jgi:hypothetical protein